MSAPASASTASASTAATPATIPDVPDQLKSVVADLLKQGAEGVHSGAVWVQGQLPDLVKQFIALNIVRDIYWIVLGALFFGLGWFFGKKVWNLSKNGHYRDPGLEVGAVFIWLMGFIGGFLLISINVYDLLQLLVAPKIYILEYVIGLVKQNH